MKDYSFKASNTASNINRIDSCLFFNSFAGSNKAKSDHSSPGGGPLFRNILNNLIRVSYISLYVLPTRLDEAITDDALPRAQASTFCPTVEILSLLNRRSTVIELPQALETTVAVLSGHFRRFNLIAWLAKSISLS